MDEPMRSHEGADSGVVRAYLKQIARVPLLTAHEELQLCREIEAARDAVDAARQEGRHQDVEGCVDRLSTLRNRLITANLRLVVAVAKRYRHASLSLPDLVQEGNLGLMKA